MAQVAISRGEPRATWVTLTPLREKGGKRLLPLLPFLFPHFYINNDYFRLKKFGKQAKNVTIPAET